MHEQWCTIGSKKERRGIISSALKFSSQNQSAANTFELHEKEVASVMESILTKVSEEVDRKKTADSDTKKSANRRGQATRKAYTNEFKYKLICEANMSSFNDIDVVQKYGINKSLLFKWKKDATNIEDAVAQKHKRLLKKEKTVNKA